MRSIWFPYRIEVVVRMDHVDRTKSPPPPDPRQIFRLRAGQATNSAASKRLNADRGKLFEGPRKTEPNPRERNLKLVRVGASLGRPGLRAGLSAALNAKNGCCCKRSLSSMRSKAHFKIHPHLSGCPALESPACDGNTHRTCGDDDDEHLRIIDHAQGSHYRSVRAYQG